MGGIINDHPYNPRQKNLVAVTTFCIVIATIAVALRLLARRQLNVNLWWDDYVAVIALVGLPSLFAGLLRRRTNEAIRFSLISLIYSPSWAFEQGSGGMQPISVDDKPSILALFASQLPPQSAPEH